ncbi:MAG: IS4 family transposase [Planctomycetaceae bacterium]
MWEEPNPPEGCEPIRWLLVTTLPIDSPEDVLRVVEYYARRWQIEVYFRTLKTGCRVEQRLFEKLPRTLNCVAVYSIIAWRVMYLCHLGRECPDLDCEIVFSPSEMEVRFYTIVHRRKLPSQPPRLNELIRMIATLGGYVDRPKTHPGTQTLWTGLQRLHCFSLAWDTPAPFFRPIYLCGTVSRCNGRVNSHLPLALSCHVAESKRRHLQRRPVR